VASHKILVIDDSRVIRMRVRDMLPQGNFDVIEAKDGVEGMEAIRDLRPNLIMLDFLLPRMSGWEVFQEIQAQPELQRIPLVLMSGGREEVAAGVLEEAHVWRSGRGTGAGSRSRRSRRAAS